MATAKDIKEYLKNTKNDKGVDLYRHLSELFSKLMRENPENAFQDFEVFSAFVNKYTFQYNEPKDSKDVNDIAARKTEASSWVEECKSLLDVPREYNEEGLLIEKRSAPVSLIPDLLADSNVLKHAGVNFGEQEIYMLQKSLVKLAEETGAQNLRFWGKIYAQKNDYFVVEGKVDPVGDELDRPEDFEKRGTGVNTQTYWVSDNILHDWVELPDVTPEQLNVARKVRKMLTGDLNASVLTNPPFPGKERHFLRAQIARITHATVLVPKGIYKPGDEDPAIIELEEEQPMIVTEELATLENWVHLHPNILDCGRTAHLEIEIPEGEENAELEEELKAKQEADPVVDRLRAVAEDDKEDEEKRPLGLETVWVNRTVGDNQSYGQEPPNEGTSTYAANCVRNLRWPGSITAQQNGRYVNFYLGYGLKAGENSFYPIQPPDVDDDPVDPREQFEPNPKDAPIEYESDTDAKPEDQGEED